MASLNYCQFENGCGEMAGIVSKLEKGETSDWSDAERKSVKRIFEYASWILEFQESIESELEDEGE